MPHPSAIVEVDEPLRGGFGTQRFGSSPFGGSSTAGFQIGGQVVIRHDRSTTKKKRLRQRQRMN